MYLSLNDSFGPSEFEAAGWNLIPGCRERDLQGIQASIKSPLAPVLATFSQRRDAQARKLAPNVYLTAGGDGCLFSAAEPARHMLTTTEPPHPDKESGKNDKRKVLTNISSNAATQKTQSLHYHHYVW